MKNRVAALALGALILLADQLSKNWVLHSTPLTNGQSITLLPILNLVLVWNHGVTFGMFTSPTLAGTIILATFAIAVISFLLIWLWRSPHLLNSLAIGAITGGAIGNVADRLRHGAVVDFLQAHITKIFFPWVFNIGDSAICCGVAVLMLESLLRPSPQPLLQPAPGSDRKTP